MVIGRLIVLRNVSKPKTSAKRVVVHTSLPFDHMGEIWRPHNHNDTSCGYLATGLLIVNYGRA